MRKPVLLILSAVLACGGDGPTVPVSRTARQPIVLVHGLGGSAADWSPVLARLRADGWIDRELAAATYSSSISNTSIAAQLASRIDSVLAATGWDKVDLVTYSMGSLSSRYYLKSLGGVANVDAWVSIAGPNHGTQTATQCVQVPACAEAVPESAFLTALNAGDETPGDVRYATWWSPCDGTIIPPESTILSEALNTETACLSHAAMFTEPIYQQVKAFIAP
ncbi:MAG: triacylglycerol lipase [Gemmatimonadaceae bacterium]